MRKKVGADLTSNLENNETKIALKGPNEFRQRKLKIKGK